MSRSAEGKRLMRFLAEDNLQDAEKTSTTSRGQRLALVGIGYAILDLADAIREGRSNA